MSNVGKKGGSHHHGRKVKFKRNISSAIIVKRNSYVNQIHTIGAAEGVMIAYITKPYSNREQAYIYPIEHHLNNNEGLKEELQIEMITCCWSESGENIQMPAKPVSKFPFHCFIRALNDVTNNTVQTRYEWAHQLCDFFNQLGSDGKLFYFPSRFTVCREFAENDNDLLPGVKYILDDHVIKIINI